MRCNGTRGPSVDRTAPSSDNGKRVSFKPRDDRRLCAAAEREIFRPTAVSAIHVQRPTTRTVKIVVAVLGVPVLLFVATIGFLLLRPPVEAYFRATRFASDTWKARSMDADLSWPTRLRMVDDLLRRHLLDNATRAQVEVMLGPADNTQYFREWDLVYRLGPERGFIRIDSEWLVLRIDQAGRVAEYRIVRD